jgi:DNA repair ATPase RecN
MTEQNEHWVEHWQHRCDELQEKLDRLQAIIQRLQTLQPSEVTPEELQAVNDELPEMLISRRYIAAVCRGMLKGGEQ